MKNLEAFLSELRDRSIDIQAENEQLRCNAPKGALTPELRTELVKRKSEISQFLQRQAFFEQAIPTIPRTSERPLSFAQQRLWFLDQLEGPSATYNMPIGLRFEGTLHSTALEQSIREIVQRHESLRSGFLTVNGSPVIQLSVISYQLPVVDLRRLPTKEQVTEVKKLLNEEAQCPFDLSKGPLLRTTLLQLSSELNVLLFNMHHIVSDGWSIGVFIRELSVLYEAFSQGQPSPLPALEIQYADFAHWQRQWLTGEVIEKQKEYWKKQLAGGPALLELPTDYPRPPVQRFRGKTEYLQLPPELTKELNALSQQTETTLFMVLLAAFATLLSRYSGQTDIVIGSPIANRIHDQIEPLIGFFVNTLVLRLNLEGNPHFEELLQRVKSVALDAYAHQDIPFEQLVDELQAGRNLSHTPLFQVLFVLQNVPMDNLELPGLDVSLMVPENVIAKFDLTLNMEETSEGISGELEYNTDLFEYTTIKRMIGHLQTLFEGIVKTPQQAIHELPLLTEKEQQQLLAWNDTATDYPRDKTLVDLFEEQVEKTPEAIAVVFEDQSITYFQLNQKANQLAHYLQSLGVKPEVYVGICLERSLEMVIGLFGILKAGGTYVPLDPIYPAARLAFMLEDANVSILLAQKKLVEGLPEHQARVVCLDSDWHLDSRLSKDNPVSDAMPSNLAYIIYTSGSTGKPKGVMISHQSLVNFLSTMRLKPGLSDQDILLAVTTISFDIAALELYLPLIVGAQIVLTSHEVTSDGIQLLKILNQSDITVMQATPATWRLLLAAGWEKNLQLKILVGGEALPRVLAHQLLEKGAVVWNLYGPTETTIWSTIYPVDNHLMSEEFHDAVESLGRPIANTQIYLLDQSQKPVPIGVPGELHIGGTGLARGYLNRPELTAEKFIKNPFSDDPNSRLYKTGDLARYLPEGNIEYLGRIDNQVKIRGFRIELGEIETILGQHPLVRENAVVVHESSNTDKRLIAYLVQHQGQVIENANLRAFLQERLPDYMIPSAFVTLDALPLTPNGKIDRRALSKNSVDSWKKEEEHFVAPRTPQEELLAGIWASVLGIERVGIHDNFFELGGHSLLATQVMSRIRDTLSVELPLRDLFESPTIQALSEHIFMARQQSPLPQITLVNRSKPLPLSFAQQRLWFLNQLEGPSATYNMPAALRLDGPLHQNALVQSLQALVQRHENLRTAFWAVKGNPVVHISESPFQLKIWDLRPLSAQEQEPEVQRLVNEESNRPFDLEKGPLFRAVLLQLGEESHVLLSNMHHIISDGWSIGVLIREFSTLYEAFLQNQPSNLPPLPIQYVDFAHWQRQWLTGEVLEQQVNYWKQQLAGVPELLELPTDHPRPPVQRFQGASLPISLSKELSVQLTHLSQQSGTTLFMTLWSAFATLLSRMSQQSDIVIGSPIANRTLSVTESLIGFFVNTLVLRLDLSDNPPFETLLQQARRVALEAYSHQDIPFEQLVEELKPERNMSHSPLFQVMFVWQNAPMSGLELAGLSLTPLEAESVIAKFDLTLSMEETADGLVGGLEYNTNLFERLTIERLIGHLKTLLNGLVANPQQPIHELPLLTETEQQQLLAWNETATDYPHEETIVDLFEQQVEKTPENLAVVFEDQQLTYFQLNQKANQLAHYLQSLGVKPEVYVGICLERSLEMVIGLFGILKAGGTYVPLDPVYPAARLAFMLEDANVSILLAQKKLVEGLPEHQARVVCLDSDWHLDSQLSRDNPVSDAMPSNLAYIIYTSGSTGKPKGVMISHQSLVNFLSTMRLKPGLSDQDILLAVTTISFDIAALELYLPLIVGAQIVLISHEVTSDGVQLLKRLNQSDITVMQATPATWRLLLAAGWEKELQLKILVGGEALPRVLAHQLLEKGAVVWNLYGPTETTIWSSIYPVDNHLMSEEFHDAVESLGRPIANTQIYLLDQFQKRVPIKVPGELHIGGTGLARGYLNRPELTAEKFIKNPFSDAPNSRLYKTGDLARYLPDGNIEYLGRIDNQVKIRGFRIELGEIETILGQHPLVRENAVVVHESSNTDKRLIAYLVQHQGQVIENADLRAFMKERLPDYMIPSAFVTLDALPLTPNGKIDRRALSKNSVDHWKKEEEHFVAPSTPQEELLAGIWASVLGVERVGIHDNFFELGGHSLLATQVMSRIRDTLSVELPLRDLFESPTIQALSEHLTRQQSPLPPITPVNRSKPLPLSFAQQRLWFLNQLEGPSATYNMPAALRLDGPLHQNALVQSLQALVQRHENLRIAFGAVKGNPVVHISESPFQLKILDLRSLSALEQEPEVQRLVNEESTRPFDLEKGPLFRAVLLQLGEESHVLLLNMHHIISDGWSIGVLIREWSTLYEAFLQNKSSNLPPLPIQYVDFAHWQRQWLTGEVLEQQVNYWKQQLAGVPALLELPTDQKRPPVQRFQGASLPISLSTELSVQLKHLSQQSGTTLFMTLWSAFATLLSRYSGQSDIVIGSPIANRTLSVTESLIGFFVNTLVLRLDLSDNPPFERLLQQARRVALEAYTHQDIPFEQLVEELQPARVLSHSPLFQVMLVLQNVPQSNLELSGLTLTPLETGSTIAKFDLTLSMEETTDGLVGGLEYNTDLFERLTIERLIGHLKILLNGLVANPQQPIQELPLLTEAEQQQLLAWNETATDYPHEKTIVDLFEQQVEKTPENLAVVFEDQQLTYLQLNQKANCVAHYLHSLGVKPEVLVGICLERSLEMVIGLLGILKAGGAYLPLDPAYPVARLAFMLEDAKVKVLLTQSSLIDGLPETTAQFVCLDTEAQTFSPFRSENPFRSVSAKNLGYVIYTSGSTGRPKGVAMEQGSLVNLISWQREQSTAGYGTKTLQFAPISFDVSFQEMFATWYSGGTLVLISEELRRNARALLSFMSQHEIDRLFLPFVALQHLAEVATDSEYQLANLREVITAGEQLQIISPIVRWFEQLRDCRLYNHYGPSESHVVTVFNLTGAVNDWPALPPIGHPIANTQIYILDPYLQAVPVGVPGELYIGGMGLARGYLNRPDLTREKFLKNPFSDDPNSRLYKTGDLARFSNDGNIEYLGRIDNQVKIRGFRIELSEIEAVLGQYPLVRENAVVVHESSKTDKRLIAYWVPHPGQVIENADLRAFLQERLPDYMIPSAFVTLDALPLTPNGKIDRRALSKNSADSYQLPEEHFVAPRTPEEELLAGIWASVLGVERVGIHDDFFEVGGHSLLATQVVSRIQEAFGVRVPLSTFFEVSTIAEIGEIVVAKQLEQVETEDMEQILAEVEAL